MPHSGKSAVTTLMAERTARLLAEKIEFVAHSSFSHPEVAETLLALPISDCDAPLGEAPTAPEGMPPYRASLYDIPLLSKEGEERLFAKLNFLKYRADLLRKQLNPKRPRVSLLDEIEFLLDEAQKARNHIAQANLRLVVAIAKKFVTKTMPLEDLLSEGHLPLIRAIELFDFSRGFKFSTYATWAIRNHFVRLISDQRKQQHRYSTGEPFVFEWASETRSAVTESESKLNRQRNLVEKYLARLQPREQAILSARFGLAEHGHAQTLSEIGRDLGISKERVRQLAMRALNRLQEFAMTSQEL